LEETGNNTGDAAAGPTPEITPQEIPQAMPQTVSAQPTAPSSEPIVAGAGQYYRNTRYIMAALTVVMGFWFGYDGFVRWPAEDLTIEKLKAQLVNADDATAARLKTELKDHSNHTDTDIRLQRILAFALPPLGICLLAWALYNSRGEYRLAEETLYVPGHPPVPLAAIRELDQSLWDRKGIARVAYELSDGRSGRATIDDFVYDRLPTDKIYDRIKAHLQPPAEAPTKAKD
jgi:hypothetical protein